MKIIALYKIWSGEEWLRASVESIYQYVEKIVLLTSDISWIGARDNPSIPVIKTMMECHDPDGKIIHLNYDEPNQLKHCMHGYNYIKKMFPGVDYIQLIDSDELWDNRNYEKALEYLKAHPGYDAYRTRMFTYIKSPFYRIDPPEPLSPCCFITTKRPDMGLEPRGCGIKPFQTMQDVWCHHFGFVRSHFNKVLEKMIQSHISEKQSYEDMSKWIPNVWNNIPNVPAGWITSRGGFHMAIGYGKNWKSIKKIDAQDLPEVLHNRKYPEILGYGK